jgi:hypothetical protein
MESSTKPTRRAAYGAKSAKVAITRRLLPACVNREEKLPFKNSSHSTSAGSRQDEKWETWFFQSVKTQETCGKHAGAVLLLKSATS